MSDRPAHDDADAAPTPTTRAESRTSHRPLQSVRVSANPAAPSERPPRKSRAFANQTLIGVAPVAVASAPAPAPAPTEAPASLPESPPPEVAVPPATGTDPRAQQASLLDSISEGWEEEPAPQPVAKPRSEPPAPAPVAQPSASDAAAIESAAPSALAGAHTEVEPAPRRVKAWLLASVAALFLGALAAWLFQPQAEPTVAATMPASPARATVADVTHHVPPKPASTVAAAPQAATTPVEGVPAQAPAPEASTTSVVVKAQPAGAKFLRAGKEVGVTTMTVELAPGERRIFEVARTGYATRKVIVDGSKSEIVVGLMPEARRTPNEGAPATEAAKATSEAP